MGNLVIVAIPEEQDRVWKISSEQIPHLTLLFLGDSENVQNVQQIMQFVQHATQLSEHGPFYLDVERRGKLGEDEADVVFFNKRSWNMKWIKQFRGQLLQNDAVRTAYDSTEQYPEWNPHLTLGYPETPAKPMGEDDHPIYSVGFDRIAVWTGNFEGPEFQLEWPDRDVYDGDLAVMYSDTQKAALMHYGVKGMQWGVRKDDIRSGLKTAGKVAAKGVEIAGDIQFENMADDGRANQIVESRAGEAFRRTDLPKINAKPEYTKARKVTHRLRNFKDPVVKQYRQETKQAYINRLEDAANGITNMSGTRQYTVRERGWELPEQGGALPTSKIFWDVTSRQIKHADGSPHTFTVETVMDDDGFIVDIRPVEDALAQTVDLGAEFLAHYGVKGMKWGVRNEKIQANLHNRRVVAEEVRRAKRPARDVRAYPTIGNSKREKAKVDTKGGEDHPPTHDAIKVAEARQKIKKSGPAAVTNKELKEVAERLQLEDRVAQLEAKRDTRSLGRKFIDKLMGDEGTQKIAGTVGKFALKTALNRRAQ